MCRFFSISIFWHPRIRQFDYYSTFECSLLAISGQPSILHWTSHGLRGSPRPQPSLYLHIAIRLKP